MPDKNHGRGISALKKEIQQKYNLAAPWYDLIEGIPELFGLKKLRKKLLQQASGKVLELAVGTGKNLPYYPGMCQVTGIDFSTAMLEMAQKRLKKLKRHVTLIIMDAEVLAFHDQCFDTVISSLDLCTFVDPIAALREMKRVCRTDGHILFLEHGRSSQKWLSRWQDRTADCYAKRLGCHWNREPLNIIQKAGLKVVYVQRTFFGIFYMIKAKPSQGTALH
jgi:ubiquinone/menaquinone biosynthesis C-methylase UbiE